MTYMLNNIEDAVDRKFLVTKAMSHQAKVGTIIHIMSAEKAGNGILIGYRVTGTGDDFSVTFENIKQFTQWARPDNFIARHYESFDLKEIQHYIKVNNRSLVNFVLPILAAALVVIWIICGAIIKGAVGIVLGVVLTIAAAVGVFYIYKEQKSKVKLDLYSKVSSDWGVVIK